MRYSHLFTEIDSIKPKRIMEVGTWNGVHALEMIERAQCHNAKIEYYGFDLFRSDDEVWARDEQGGKGRPPVMSKVLAKLTSTKAKINLTQGDTNVTLPDASLPTMDFVFIDGGHSLGTIANDWAGVQPVMGPATTVIFDDYYADSMDKGCRATVESIDPTMFNVEIMEGTDEFKKPWGVLRINFVKVTKVDINE